jgi:hypothetical protein
MNIIATLHQSAYMNSAKPEGTLVRFEDSWNCILREM